jgi:hypothetical protein
MASSGLNDAGKSLQTCYLFVNSGIAIRSSCGDEVGRGG